ncbi:NAD(P)-dependent oxidoreductase [Sphingobium phenoxybenzoativorans]|uniref:NAD(P)-dependent oxidoreductase n=1 Tax=Sphingobium phenoxybenzoativorans TaxID=1592790 RepID=A0A975K6I0_9SPHN|nr:NAD(P)-dependent oxidoreductase [Sphingobium phenoxybenzoativorans]QUT05684.1 NAD(P)-dependent oxidoreductase [Sphingobium phenoxybenzoativorans]
MKLAVLGAAGFIGQRIVTLLRAHGGYAVVPVTRRTTGAIAHMVEADARDEQSVTRVLQGCEAVIVSIAGSADMIEDIVAPIYSASEKAGVSRIIYLSTGVVHGQAPDYGTDESSMLRHVQPFAYNLAKIRAEECLAAMRRGGDVEVVILRPTVVYGPGSRWTQGFADDLYADVVTVFDRGQGICNAVYIDNLVHAIEQALHAKLAPCQAFLINDKASVRWRDLQEPVARALGIDFDQLPHLSSEEVLARYSGPLSGRRIPNWIRQIKQRIVRDHAWSEAAYEQALLQSCRYQLPIAKAEKILGYSPPVSFEDGLRRSVASLNIPARRGLPI